MLMKIFECVVCLHLLCANGQHIRFLKRGRFFRYDTKYHKAVQMDVCSDSDNFNSFDSYRLYIK